MFLSSLQKVILQNHCHSRDEQKVSAKENEKRDIKEGCQIIYKNVLICFWAL